MSSWKHPGFGEFTFDGYAWRGSIQTTVFDGFNHPTGRVPEKPNVVDIFIWSIDASDTPSSAAAALVARVHGNLDRLADAVLTALVAELAGHGPDTGMWWHGNPGEVEEAIASATGATVRLSAPTRNDLRRLLSLPTVFIRKDSGADSPTTWDNAMPLAELSFSSPIDEEHGIGFLTDGDDILGIGYSDEVDAWA